MTFAIELADERVHLLTRVVAAFDCFVWLLATQLVWLLQRIAKRPRIGAAPVNASVTAGVKLDCGGRDNMYISLATSHSLDNHSQ